MILTKFTDSSKPHGIKSASFIIFTDEEESDARKAQIRLKLHTKQLSKI